MFILEKSREGDKYPEKIGEYQTMKAAKDAALKAGATGKAKPAGPNEWLFSGGQPTVGFWISQQ